MSAALAGFALGFSLILAIGAQNAFVLRQGIRREHVLAVVLTCAVSDAILIAAGVAGFGLLIEQLPWLHPVMLYGGVAFLAVYGARLLWAAYRGGEVLTPERVKDTFGVDYLCFQHEGRLIPALDIRKTPVSPH